MASKRKVEIFSAGCRICSDIIEKVEAMACSSCDVVVLDMYDKAVWERARSMGISSVPTVAVNGVVIPTAAKGGLDETALRAAGVGREDQLLIGDGTIRLLPEMTA